MECETCKYWKKWSGHYHWGNCLVFQGSEEAENYLNISTYNDGEMSPEVAIETNEKFGCNLYVKRRA